MCIFNKFSKYTAESGRSMVEMLGVLAIIGVLTVGGVAGFNFAMNKHRANEIIQGVKERAVIGSGQRINDHAVDFHEFPELIIDYTTSGRNTGLNGEKEFFSVDVADVPQAVCQNVLNMNWDWPSGVFVNGVREDTCPAENSQMTFVFAADLSGKIAQEQDPCYGYGQCCRVLDTDTRQIEVGQLLLDKICRGTNNEICCSPSTLDCRYGEDIDRYEPFQDTRSTCLNDGKHKCDNQLNCICRNCPNGSMVQNAACDCSCPSGYQDNPCDTGYYQDGVLNDTFGNTLCYKCTACPGNETPPANKCSVARTEAGQNGCPDRTVYNEVPCACDSGYTTNACVAGTNYQMDMKTLTDGTQCYKCAECPQDETKPADRCTESKTEAGQNGCPSRTVYKDVTPDACHQCVNGQLQLKDPRQTLVKGDTCCEPSEKDSTKCKVPCSGTGTACQECDDTTGEWKNLPTNSKARGYDCGKCDSKGKVVKDTSVKVPDCKTCNSKTFMFDNKKDGTVCGTCGKCGNGTCAGDYTATTTVKKYGGNNTACCQNTTVSYCPLRGKPADECTGDKVVCRDACGIGSHCDTSRGSTLYCRDQCTGRAWYKCAKGYKKICYQGSCKCRSTWGGH